MPVNNFLITWDPTNKKWTAREDGGAAYDLVENSLHETVQYNEIAAPAVSAANTCKLYMDSTAKRIKISQNTGAYQNLLPMNTKGDLQTFSTAVTRLPVGANGKVLEADSTQATGLKWGTKTTSPLTTKGDLWGYDTADARVPKGADYRFLIPLASDAQGVSWFLPPYCYVYRSGTFLTTTGTSHNVVWNATTSDAWNMHPGSSTTVTVPYEGKYLVEVSMDVKNRNGHYWLRCYPSTGVQHLKGYKGQANLGDLFYPHASWILTLPASGTLYIQVRQNTGGTRTWASNATWSRLRVVWLGPYN
jgi:hypothetical protein